MTFEEWLADNFFAEPNGDTPENQLQQYYARLAWDYQQARIDELEKERDEIEEDRDELELALSKMETLTGYVLVPVEPTDMALDFYIRYHNFYPFGNDVKNIARHFYKAMIQAAQERE